MPEAKDSDRGPTQAKSVLEWATSPTQAKGGIEWATLRLNDRDISAPIRRTTTRRVYTAAIKKGSFDVHRKKVSRKQERRNEESQRWEEQARLNEGFFDQVERNANGW